MKTHYSDKIAILGYTGYIGEEFAAALRSQAGETFYLTRSVVDYTDFRQLRCFLEDVRPTFLINCAGFTGKPNVDACETRRAQCILGNVVLPQTIADACEASRIPWGHVSSGCIYSGAKLKLPSGNMRTEKFLMMGSVRSLWESNRTIIVGFNESDAPNFSFHDEPCSFYSGTKAAGEEILTNRENVFVWRLRIPFDHIDCPRNYLSKIQNYAKVYNNVNSLSHRGDFVKACLELWRQRATFGTYNVTNPGYVTTVEVVEQMKVALKLHRSFEFFEDDEHFYKSALAPRSNTVLDTTKLLQTGVQMRDVSQALEDSLHNWAKSNSSDKRLQVQPNP